MEKEIFRTVYISKATTLHTDADLLEILKQARRNNTELDVTGLLIYKDKSFIQLIEGPLSSIKRVFSAIKRDTRHYRIKCLIDCERVEARAFPQWSMGFKHLSMETAIHEEGFVDFFGDGFVLTDLYAQAAHDTAIKLLMYFRQAS